MNLFKRFRKVENPIPKKETVTNTNVRYWMVGNNAQTLSTTDVLIDSYITYVLAAVSVITHIKFDHYPSLLEFTKDFAQSDFVERNEDLAKYIVTEVLSLTVILASSNIPDDEDFNVMIRKEIGTFEEIRLSNFTIELMLRGSIKQVTDYVSRNFVEARGEVPFATVESEITH